MGYLILIGINLGIIIGIALLFHRRSLRKRIYRLTVLRLELGRLRTANKISEALHDRLLLQIEAELTQSFDRLGVCPDSSKWRSLRDRGWNILKLKYYLSGLPDIPPWKESPPPKPSRQEKPPAGSERRTATVPESVSETTVATTVPPPLPAFRKPDEEDHTEQIGRQKIGRPVHPAPEDRIIFPKPPVPGISAVSSDESGDQNREFKTGPVMSVVKPSASEPAVRQTPAKKPPVPKLETGTPAGRSGDASEFAWKPQKPKAAEKALAAVSGWSGAFAPFLVQNIGWFISVISFVAGSVFLITYTAGFVRSLIIAVFLSGYTLMMIFGAYMILRRRPELRTAGSVLITIGMLLIPLSLAASVRLIDMNYPSPGKSATGFVLCVISISVFYLIAQLASGIMSRSLIGLHVRLFMILASVQITAPILSRTSAWVFPAIVHLIIFGVLAFGVFRFITDWLTSVFADRSRIAFFAAGTLIYAAIVSFVHSAWRFDGHLPAGYAGVYLMLLSGLLFYADSHFQKWTKQFPLITRFTFGVYALSALAVILAFPAYPSRLVSLITGAAVYAAVFWHYTSLPPLYLLIACLAGIYHQVFLKFVPPDMYFSASVPGLAGLFFLCRWFLKRRGAKLAALMFRIFAGLTAGLIIFSLYRADPGFSGFITGAAAMTVVYAVLRCIPADMFRGLGLKVSEDDLKKSGADLLKTPLFYAIPILSAITLAYAPVVLTAGWTAQFAVAMTVHAGFWTWAGFRMMTGDKTAIPNQAYIPFFFRYAPCSVCAFNISIFSIIAGIAAAPVCVPAGPLNNPFLIPVLLVCGGILAWQSIGLRIQALFYGALIAEGAAGALIKFTYFPGPSAGFAEMMTALIIFGVIRHLERMPEEFAVLLRETGVISEQIGRTKRILGLFPIRSQVPADVIRTPLQQAMGVLWAWSLIRLGIYLTTVGVSPIWAANSGLGALLTALLAARFGWIQLWFAPVGLGLAAFMGLTRLAAGFNIPALSFTAAGYALIIWLLTRKMIPTSFMLKGIRLLRFEKITPDALIQIERMTHRTGLFITICAGAVFFDWMAWRSASVLPAIAAAACFFQCSAVSYRRQIYSYGMILSVIWIAFVLYARFFVPFPVISAGAAALTAMAATASALAWNPATGFLLSVLCVCMFGTERIIRLQDHGDDKGSGDESFAVSLFRKPLCVSASVLAVCAGVQQVMIMTLKNDLPPLSVLNLMLGAAGLLLCNIRLRMVHLNLAAVVMGVIAVLSAETLLFHHAPVAAFFTFKEDQWITLAVLTVILASLSLYFHPVPERKRLYGVPIWQVSAGLFCLSMGKAVPSAIGAFLNIGIQACDPVFFVILSAALFPMLYPLSAGVQIRGVGVLLFATVLAVQTASLSGIQGWSFAFGAAWAFVLWGLSAHVLPAFNRRYEKWAIDPAVWQWAGLLLVLCHLLYSTLLSFHRLLSYDPAVVFSAFDITGVIPAAAYCALMNYARRRADLSWITSGCVYIAAFHLTGAALDATGIVQHQWLNLAFASVGIHAAVLIAAKIRAGADQATLYSGPVSYLSAGGYAWSFLGALISIQSLFPFHADFLTGITFVIISFGIYMTDIRYVPMPALRGVGLFLLLTASVYSFSSMISESVLRTAVMTLFPYAAWGIAEFAAPGFNQRFPKLRTDASAWAWFGLILVIFVQPFTEGTPPDILRYPFWLSVSVYLFLLMRNSANPVISWAATGTLTLAVLPVLCPPSSVLRPLPSDLCLLSAVIWANILLIGIHFRRRYGLSANQFTGWKYHDLDTPLLVWSSLTSCLVLMRYIVTDAASVAGTFSSELLSSAHIWVTLLLAGTFLHLLMTHSHRIFAHLFLLSVFRLLFSTAIPEPEDICHIALLTAVWSILLIVSGHFLKKRTEGPATIIRSAIQVWSPVCPWLSLAALTLLPVKTLAESLLVLAILTGVMTYLGRERNQAFLRLMSRALMLIFIHTWPMIIVPSKKVQGLALWQIWPLIAAKYDQLQILLPWYSLQLMIIVFALQGFRKLLINRFQRDPALADIIPVNIRFIVILALCEWGLHLITFFDKLRPLPPPDAWIHGIAAIASSCLIIILGAKQMIRTGKIGQVYGVILLACATGVYIRLMISGVLPLCVWDTAAITASAVICLFIQRITRLPLLAAPLFQTTFALPIFALMTVPWYPGSVHAAGALTAAAALYLSLHYSTGRSSLLYLAFAMINGAMYLWTPLWATQYDLIQLYVVPMAMSVLVMLQLHKNELKRSVLNGSRLAALSALYAGALADAFLRPDLWIFLLALMLSLSGVMAGIALRIRAFLYGGVIFLVLNIAGQLIRFYPEDRLGKGIALIILGAAMLAVMIWFNIRRETILKRIRIFRSDLTLWE